MNPLKNPYSRCSFTINDKPKVLIVDDNKIINDSNKKLVSNILIEKGVELFDIIQLYDGYEIIKYVLNHQDHYEKIKFILTDESMDYMNGSESISFIRKLEKGKNLKPIKIASLTCYENSLSTNLILNAGADVVLNKPVSKNNLMDFINLCFGFKI